MKTKQIRGKVDILLVDGLPDKHEIELGQLIFRLTISGIIEGNWKFISTIENLSEEDADGLVEVSDKYKFKSYKNYHNDKITITALGSFYGLIAAQSETYFSPSTTLIFVKE